MCVSNPAWIVQSMDTATLLGCGVTTNESGYVGYALRVLHGIIKSEHQL